MRLRYVIGGLILASGGLVTTLVPVTLVDATAGSTTQTTTRQIAVATLDHDFRTTLTAIKGPSQSGAPLATVEVAAYDRFGDKWKLIGRQTVGDPKGWFWNVVTGEGAICRFSASDVAPHPIEVRLLVSLSIRCSQATYNFHLDKYGNFIAG